MRWVLRHARDTIEHVVGRGTVAAVIVERGSAVHSTYCSDMIRTTTRPLREELRRRARTPASCKRRSRHRARDERLLGVVVAEVIRGSARPMTRGSKSVLALLWPAFQR